ncbi:hypothetical protein CSPX01_01525 [Colletotrichum filicis]|nr:hypothetical protein CSPX01_01525 [Colletotrichum filicis]
MDELLKPVLPIRNAHLTKEDYVNLQRTDRENDVKNERIIALQREQNGAEREKRRAQKAEHQMSTPRPSAPYTEAASTHSWTSDVLSRRQSTLSSRQFSPLDGSHSIRPQPVSSTMTFRSSTAQEYAVNSSVDALSSTGNDFFT